MQRWCGAGSGKDHHEQAPKAWSQQENCDSGSSCWHCTALSVFLSWHNLLTTCASRFRPGLSLMAATSFPELEMKPPRGEVLTRGPSQPTPLRTVWGDTCRRTLCTPAYDRLVWLPSLVVGIPRLRFRWMDRSAMDPSQAPVARSKARRLAVPVYT
jgi:hypothetical protein